MYFFYGILVVGSFVGMTFMVFLKMFEMRTGKEAIFAKASVKADPHIRRTLKILFELALHINLTSLRKIVSLLTHLMLHLFGTIGLFVAKYYGMLTSRLRGKKLIKGGGIVSFFLKDVSESREKKEDK